jgi:putative spermidine/putrescine transport system ATP-binding protein
VALGRPLPGAAGDAVSLALRPEAVRLGAEGCDTRLPATIEDVQFLGSVIRVRARVAGAVVSLDTFNRAEAPPPPAGAAVEIGFNARDVIALGD